MLQMQMSFVHSLSSVHRAGAKHGVAADMCVSDHS